MLMRMKCQLRRHRWIVIDAIGMHVHNAAIARNKSNLQVFILCHGQRGTLPTAIQAIVQYVSRWEIMPTAPYGRA